MPPGRRITGVFPSNPTMVLSRPTLHGPAIENHVNRFPQLLLYMSSRCGANAAKPVCGWCSNRPLRPQFRRAKHAQQGDPAPSTQPYPGPRHILRHVAAAPQYQCQRSGPETFSQPPSLVRHLARPMLKAGYISKMDNKRMIHRPFFDFEYAPHCGRLRNLRAQTIDRFSREMPPRPPFSAGWQRQ